MLLEYSENRGYEIYSADFSFHEGKIEKAASLFKKRNFSMHTPFNLTKEELCSYLTAYQKKLVEPLAGFKNGSVSVQRILSFLSKNFGLGEIAEYTSSIICEKYKINRDKLKLKIKIGEEQCPWVQIRSNLIGIYLPYTVESLASFNEYIYFIAGEGYYNLTGSDISSCRIERALMLKKPKLQLFIQGREPITIKVILEKLTEIAPFHLKYITNIEGQEAIEIADLSPSDDLDAYGYVVIETAETDLKQIERAVCEIRRKDLEVKSIAEMFILE